jgi:hypothetical protein
MGRGARAWDRKGSTIPNRTSPGATINGDHRSVHLLLRGSPTSGEAQGSGLERPQKPVHLRRAMQTGPAQDTVIPIESVGEPGRIPALRDQGHDGPLSGSPGRKHPHPVHTGEPFP